MFRSRARQAGLAAAAFLILGCAGAATPAPKPAKPAAPSGTTCPTAQQLDPAQLEQEAVCLLRQYVQIDTTNPPGNELAAAAFLRGLLSVKASQRP